MKGLTDPATFESEANKAAMFQIALELGGRSVEEWSHVITAHEVMEWSAYRRAIAFVQGRQARIDDFEQGLRSGK